MNKHIEFSLDLSATDNKIRDRGAVFASKDKGSVSILIRVYKYKIKDTDEIKVLSVFENSGNRVFEDAIVLDGIARYDFDTSLITENDTVTNYVYIKSGDKEADIGGFSFDVMLSEIDRGAEIVKNHYDKNYEALLADFKERIEDFIDGTDLSEISEDISTIQTNIGKLSDSMDNKTDYNYVHELLLDIELTPGPQGSVGPEGPKGDRGEQGLQGLQGPEGPQGEPGEQGIQGLKGADGTDGLQGLKGDTGEQGPIGKTGEQGPKGEIGPQGEQGPEGPEGLQGLKGDKGDTGQDGTSVNIVDTLESINLLPAPTQENIGEGYLIDGDLHISTGSEWNNVGGIQGPRGIQGEQGEVGPRGLKGDTGDQGLKGDTGLRGPQGEQGIEGPRGPIGEQGPIGLQGDIGPQGEQGIQGPQGLPGQDGRDVDLTEVQAMIDAQIGDIEAALTQVIGGV